MITNPSVNGSTWTLPQYRRQQQPHERRSPVRQLTSIIGLEGFSDVRMPLFWTNVLPLYILCEDRFLIPLS